MVERVEVAAEWIRATAVRAAQGERHALHRGALRVGHAGQRLEVRVQVDEARRNDQTGRVDDTLRAGDRNRTALDAHDLTVRDGDVTAKARRAAAVDDRAAGDD